MMGGTIGAKLCLAKISQTKKHVNYSTAHALGNLPFWLVNSTCSVSLVV